MQRGRSWSGGTVQSRDLPSNARSSPIESRIGGLDSWQKRLCLGISNEASTNHHGTYEGMLGENASVLKYLPSLFLLVRDGSEEGPSLSLIGRGDTKVHAFVKTPVGPANGNSVVSVVELE